jgi:hypothetical protein
LTSSPVNFCKTKMADKKSPKPSSSRNPNPAKNSIVKNEQQFSLGLVTPRQLATYDPHQITPVNSLIKTSSSRMVSLGKPIQQSPFFAKALTSDYDPFAKKVDVPPPTTPTQTQYIKTSPYFPLYSHKLFHIEFHNRKITNPLTLIKYFYPTNPDDGAQLHFAPSDPQKTLHYYQNILQHEGFVIISTLYDKFSNGRVLNHKLKIVKITSLKSWGSHPFLLKPLRGHSIKYSYYDYIDAWFKIFLYQNDHMTHSWFIQWSKEFNIIKPECQIPMWFLKWWSQHGAQAKIFPDVLQTEQSTKTLKESFLHFTKTYKFSEYNSNFPPILPFCAKFHVPWIVKWYYQIEDNVLIRSFAVKWFDKFNRDRIINFVYNEFPIKQVKKIEDKPSSSNSSVKDFLKGKSLEELVEIAQMAAIQCRQSTSGKHSPTSSERSSSAKPFTPVSFPLKWYQDAQDSYEDYEDYDLNLD